MIIRMRKFIDEERIMGGKEKKRAMNFDKFLLEFFSHK